MVHKWRSYLLCCCRPLRWQATLACHCGPHYRQTKGPLYMEAEFYFCLIHNDGFWPRWRVLSCLWIECRCKKTFHLHWKYAKCSSRSGQDAIVLVENIFRQLAISQLSFSRRYLEALFCCWENAVLQQCFQPVCDCALKTVTNSDILSWSQWPHLATHLHKRKGHSNRKKNLYLVHGGIDWDLLISSLAVTCARWYLFPTDAAEEQLDENFLVKVTRQWREQLGCREKVRSENLENLSSCFYQEYANKCMLDGDTSGMWILSPGAAANANVLIGHFARRSAI